MRLGFFLGFLIGALVASVASERQPESAGDAAAGSTTPEPEGVIDKLKLHARQVMTVARKAAADKEAEMLRQFEAAKQQHRSD